MWVPATVVLLAIIGAGVLMPSGDGDAAPAATPAAERTTATVDAGAEPRAIASPDGDGDVDGDGDGADTAPSGMSSDPEVAVLELVSDRAACLLDRDVECLADVLQAGSPAESSDRVAIAAVSTPIPAAEWHPVEAVLVDLLGGAALVDVIVSTPDGVGSVPVLIVRSGERWLIRTVLADPAPTAQP